jgi:hypothetical protein
VISVIEGDKGFNKKMTELNFIYVLNNYAIML